MTAAPAHWEAWVDGTALPNPGRIGIGLLLVAPDGTQQALSRAPGRSGCNNKAELRATLLAVGIDADDRRIDELLPSYEGMLSGAARLRALDLGDVEPSVVFRLPFPSDAGRA